MRKIENKLNIHFFGLPPISVISFRCAARMCLLLIKNANLDLKGGGGGARLVGFMVTGLILLSL